MTYDLSDYVDVAERIRIFKERYPDGSLQSELTLTNGDNPGWLCKAYAFRDKDDERPGIGHAFEPVPGKTPYTKDSEAMNAETSAWGRAIVALGFETKKIASADEVRARGSGAGDMGGSSRTAKPAPGEFDEELYLQKVEYARRAGAKPSEQVVHFGKHKGKLLMELTPAQVGWLANKWKLQDTPSEYDHRLKLAAVTLHSGDDGPDFDVPFS